MIKIIVADDHQIVREGLKRIISECSDMTLVAEAEDANSVFAQCDSHEVDVLLLDVSMPGPGFLDTLSRVNGKHPNIKVLVLSVYPENHYAVRAIKAGASGYLTKNHSSEELANAIRHISNGKKYITSVLAEQIIEDLQTKEGANTYKVLSSREYQILSMLGKGKTINDISIILSLSPKTVSTYRTRILEKLKLENTAELIRYAIENELEE